MSKIEIEVSFSKQSETMLKSMPGINKDELIEWVAKKGLKIGGGEVIDYLEKIGSVNR